jgi:hypothetical protein
MWLTTWPELLIASNNRILHSTRQPLDEARAERLADRVVDTLNAVCFLVDLLQTICDAAKELPGSVDSYAPHSDAHRRLRRVNPDDEEEVIDDDAASQIRQYLYFCCSEPQSVTSGVACVYRATILALLPLLETEFVKGESAATLSDQAGFLGVEFDRIRNALTGFQRLLGAATMAAHELKQISAIPIDHLRESDEERMRAMRGKVRSRVLWGFDIQVLCAFRVANTFRLRASEDAEARDDLNARLSQAFSDAKRKCSEAPEQILDYKRAVEALTNQ